MMMKASRHLWLTLKSLRRHAACQSVSVDMRNSRSKVAPAAVLCMATTTCCQLSRQARMQDAWGRSARKPS